MKIALLCSGLGNVHRGHEVFARDLFELLRDSLDITLFKGGGEPGAQELVIDNIPRYDPLLEHVHVVASQKWEASVKDQERGRTEAETFAYACLKPLLAGDYDVIHCLEREVCDIVYDKRHLFRRTPKVLFSNGGAIPARGLPKCDFVQEHTELNLAYSDKKKAFLIPHGVDVDKFRPGIETDFRSKHGIPADAFVVITVGAISFGHKRVDYVVREVAAVPDAYLIVAGQETNDTPAIRALARELMGERAVFVTLPHSELPKAYAAANVFTLGSVFETFGIVYIEAMAMGLPVICTNHRNQRNIVKRAIFIDVQNAGALTQSLMPSNRHSLSELIEGGRQIAVEHYALTTLRKQYVHHYESCAAARTSLPTYSVRAKIRSNVSNLVAVARRLVHGRSE